MDGNGCAWSASAWTREERGGSGRRTTGSWLPRDSASAAPPPVGRRQQEEEGWKKINFLGFQDVVHVFIARRYSSGLVLFNLGPYQNGRISVKFGPFGPNPKTLGVALHKVRERKRQEEEWRDNRERGGKKVTTKEREAGSWCGGPDDPRPTQSNQWFASMWIAPPAVSQPLFLGAGDSITRLTRPYKWIFRGEWCPHPPL